MNDIDRTIRGLADTLGLSEYSAEPAGALLFRCSNEVRQLVRGLSELRQSPQPDTPAALLEWVRQLRRQMVETEALAHERGRSNEILMRARDEASATLQRLRVAELQLRELGKQYDRTLKELQDLAALEDRCIRTIDGVKSPWSETDAGPVGLEDRVRRLSGAFVQERAARERLEVQLAGCSVVALGHYARSGETADPKTGRKAYPDLPEKDAYDWAPAHDEILKLRRFVELPENEARWTAYLEGRRTVLDDAVEKYQRIYIAAATRLDEICGGPNTFLRDAPAHVHFFAERLAWTLDRLIDAFAATRKDSTDPTARRQLGWFRTMSNLLDEAKIPTMDAAGDQIEPPARLKLLAGQSATSARWRDRYQGLARTVEQAREQLINDAAVRYNKVYRGDTLAEAVAGYIGAASSATAPMATMARVRNIALSIGLDGVDGTDPLPVLERIAEYFGFDETARRELPVEVQKAVGFLLFCASRLACAISWSPNAFVERRYSGPDARIRTVIEGLLDRLEDGSDDEQTTQELVENLALFEVVGGAGTPSRWLPTPLRDPVQACRICGCTNEDCSGCIARTGQACTWAEPDLCSACDLAPPPEKDDPHGGREAPLTEHPEDYAVREFRDQEVDVVRESSGRASERFTMKDVRAAVEKLRADNPIPPALEGLHDRPAVGRTHLKATEARIAARVRNAVKPLTSPGAGPPGQAVDPSREGSDPSSSRT